MTGAAQDIEGWGAVGRCCDTPQKLGIEQLSACHLGARSRVRFSPMTSTTKGLHKVAAVNTVLYGASVVAQGEGQGLSR